MMHRSFSAMLDDVLQDSGISREVLLPEIKAIHQRHGTAEYSFLIEELPSLKEKHPSGDLAEIYSKAIERYREERTKHLRLYPGVMNTLRTLKEQGCRLVLYTESLGFYTNDRIRRLSLDGLIDCVYSPPDHDKPANIDTESVRRFPREHYDLKMTEQRHTPKGEIKPNPAILRQIIEEMGGSYEETLYVGDSLMKDVHMAQDAGVTDVWASYGESHEKNEYDLLREVTHWTDEDVEREKRLAQSEVNPHHTLETGFSEILGLFRFVPFGGAASDKTTMQVETWKTTIAVQEHFNEIAMKIRNIAITLVGALLGAVAFAAKEGLLLRLFGVTVPASSFIVLVALMSLCAFYLMDRFWYHRLLYGAVNHGLEIEETLKAQIPTIGLTTAIKKESPIKLFGKFEIGSTEKIDIFYFLSAVVLIALFVLFLFVERPAQSTEAEAVTAPAQVEPAPAAPPANATETPDAPAQSDVPAQPDPPVSTR